jgi:pimeloyl-ACP methyl ester carboxylesterase
MERKQDSYRIETLNGQQIYFELHGAGEPLLLLHGFSGSSQDWKRTLAGWGDKFQLILADLRGHGRSGILAKQFRHEDAAHDLLALLDHLKIARCKAVGISGGGNVLLHIATKQPKCVSAMVLVSATPYFPEPARDVMRRYSELLPPEARAHLRQIHPCGEEQIEALLASATGFANDKDDLKFSSADLAKIHARTLIIQGDRDPLYPVELSVEMARAIPKSSLWIIPDSGHGPVLGPRWPECQRVATEFLLRQ